MSVTYFGPVPILNSIPTELTTHPKTVPELISNEKKVVRKAQSQWFNAMTRKPTMQVYSAPPLAGVKSTVGMNIVPTINSKLIQMAKSPLTSFAGNPLQQQIARRRKDMKGYLVRETLFDTPTLMEHYGPVSQFKRGSGMGTDKWGAMLPFMKMKQEADLPIMGPYSKEGLMFIRKLKLKGEQPMILRAVNL